MISSPRPVIHWFRRDLRLSDNLALHAAIYTDAPVIPLFIFDPAILKSDRSGAARMAFLLKGLAALDSHLRHYGSRLLIRRGKPFDVLRELILETDASAIYFNRDYSPFAVKRDEAIIQAYSIPIHIYDDALLLPPGKVMTAEDKPYTVYTPFKNNWRKHNKPEISKISIRSDHFHTLEDIAAHDLPILGELGFSDTFDLPDASENVAQHNLASFMERDIYAYSEGRNRLTAQPFAEKRPAGSSYLSPYFRFGILSPRQAYWSARDAFAQAGSEQASESVSTWVDELIWREFYMHIMVHFPHVDKGNFRPQYDGLQWRYAPDELQAWQEGQTGYPVVDAAMRQLCQVGWMPNRARMIVASFLTKDLFIHWQEGERHFMHWLIDGDPAANNGGWQWAAGTGTDAQPYFRIFNPVSQSQKFDPQGDYIRYWLPELRDVPVKFIHVPWQMPSPPKNYPPPMVDHSMARERTLAAFKVLKIEENNL